MSDSMKNRAFAATPWNAGGAARAGDMGGQVKNGEGFRTLYPVGEKKGGRDGFVASFVSEEKARAIANAKKRAHDSSGAAAKEDPDAVKRRAYDDAFTRGEAAGLEEGRRRAREIVERLEGIAAQIETAWTNLIETHESRIIELVARAAEKVVYGQAEIEQDMVRRAIIEALRIVPEPVNVQIAVNPKDYEYIDTVKEDFFSHIKALKDVSVTPDPAINQGGCNVRTRFGEVDATLESRLEAIRECLLKANGKKTVTK